MDFWIYLCGKVLNVISGWKDAKVVIPDCYKEVLIREVNGLDTGIEEVVIILSVSPPKVLGVRAV